MSFKVWTFWETHKIWKNLPYGFDKSADLLSKCQNHKADFFQIMCAFQKVRTLIVVVENFHYCGEKFKEIMIEISDDLGNELCSKI